MRTVSLVPAEPDETDSPWYSWIQMPDVWNAAPTMLLPPAKPVPPVPIPEGVYLIPTDMLPPPMLDIAPRTPTSIRPPDMVGPIQISNVVEGPLKADVAPSPKETPILAETAVALPIAEFPLERCAAIAASLSLRPADTMTILEMHGLNPPTWQALERRWSVAIKTALDEGDPTLLRAYDDAFVSSLENLRGPITADDHARIVAARGRGRSTDVFKALGLPTTAAVRIERVMLQRATRSH
jgi:hypothetical protein